MSKIEKKKYSREHILFIFSQVEKKLEETVCTRNAIQSRARFQLIFSFGILTSMISYLGTKTVYDTFFFNALCIAILSGISMIFAVAANRKYSINTKGSLSKDLWKDQLYTDFKERANAELNLILSECKSYDKRIEENRAKNTERMDLVIASYYALILIPIALFILYFIL